PAAPKGCTAGSGRGPLEKDPHSGNLASGLPVLQHGVPLGREFCVALAVDGDMLRIDVRDSGDGQPMVRAPFVDATDGRGLFLVSQLADDFGVTEHVVGKSVWLDFKLEQPRHDEA
ncbi:ATP-binding protein, partial [Streptomyces sp. NPDC059909]|uniref:ATP-binding protein n=1 Tax=Streptomyces sp. NPDC059909 TaxID=3346998 RepID=UPI003662FD0E